MRSESLNDQIERSFDEHTSTWFKKKSRKAKYSMRQRDWRRSKVDKNAVDLDRLAKLRVKSLKIAGCQPEDIMHLVRRFSLDQNNNNSRSWLVVDSRTGILSECEEPVKDSISNIERTVDRFFENVCRVRSIFDTYILAMISRCEFNASLYTSYIESLAMPLRICVSSTQRSIILHAISFEHVMKMLSDLCFVERDIAVNPLKKIYRNGFTKVIPVPTRIKRFFCLLSTLLYSIAAGIAFQDEVTMRQLLVGQLIPQLLQTLERCDFTFSAVKNIKIQRMIYNEAPKCIIAAVQVLANLSAHAQFHEIFNEHISISVLLNLCDRLVTKISDTSVTDFQHIVVMEVLRTVVNLTCGSTSNPKGANRLLGVSSKNWNILARLSNLPYTDRMITSIWRHYRGSPVALLSDIDRRCLDRIVSRVSESCLDIRKMNSVPQTAFSAAVLSMC